MMSVQYTICRGLSAQYFFNNCDCGIKNCNITFEFAIHLKKQHQKPEQEPHYDYEHWLSAAQGWALTNAEPPRHQRQSALLLTSCLLTYVHVVVRTPGLFHKTSKQT